MLAFLLCLLMAHFSSFALTAKLHHTDVSCCIFISSYALLDLRHLLHEFSSFLLYSLSFCVTRLITPQSPCLSCSVALIAGEDQVLEEGMVHNGCHDDHKTNSGKVS